MSEILGIIGGTGLTRMDNLVIDSETIIQTPFGDPSAPLINASLNGHRVAFLARHGQSHQFLPHKVNYRANIWAMHQQGIKKIIAVNAVGGIHPDMNDGHIVIPHQIIDYTYEREHSFFDGRDGIVEHMDFTYPYDESLRKIIIATADNLTAELNFQYHDRAVYACTQGPRLETAAEVNRLERDGCDVAGMTGMPETILARELKMAYGAVNLVVNKAAGRSDKLITMDHIRCIIDSGMNKIQKIIQDCVIELAAVDNNK